MQGIADEGTPPRDSGDTYSQSTDPSDDEEEDIADHSYKPDGSTALDRHADAQEAPSSSAQPAQQHQSLEEEPSVALDTQNDPADNVDMQEGETECIAQGVGLCCLASGTCSIGKSGYLQVISWM